MYQMILSFINEPLFTIYIWANNSALMLHNLNKKHLLKLHDLD